MYKFPDGVYTDIRLEDVFETAITVTLDEIDELKEKSYQAAFIRVYDGSRWYYSATSETKNIQKEIDNLAGIAENNSAISDTTVVKKIEVNKGEFLKFTGENDISRFSVDEKFKILSSYFPIFRDREYVQMWRGQYIDRKVTKTILSSKGTNLKFDQQKIGFRMHFELADGDEKFRGNFDKSGTYLHEMEDVTVEAEERYVESVNFLKNAKPVEEGNYTVLLSPVAAGVFAHESFGHKSESDFMLGDETMKKEWNIGKKVGSGILSIIDDGGISGSGYVPFDDEGTKTKKTYLIKDGILSGRLHSAVTAAEIEEDLTGNARAINFEFEPIVRMTTTYIDKGEKTKKELINEIKDGIIVNTIKHGSGLSTFTIAPSLAYRIRDGKIAEPVKISVVSGNVFKALGDIDGLSDKVELLSFALGGCGKMEQFPLSVGFGGPWVRVNNLSVQ
jgi:TldD protein